jgi:hypothetical protein
MKTFLRHFLLVVLFSIIYMLILYFGSEYPDFKTFMFSLLLYICCVKLYNKLFNYLFDD